VARRFLTVEDVRRAAGPEIVTEADTLVTPQALEAARAAGIRIRAPGGEYVEPAPDRGPDAQRAAYALPHLPEPDVDPELTGTGAIVTVVGRNRPGILAEITTVLGAFDVNIENISQRMIDEYFHLVLTVDIPPGGAFPALREALQCLGGEDDYAVRVMHERVFRFMHRV